MSNFNKSFQHLSIKITIGLMLIGLIGFVFYPHREVAGCGPIAEFDGYSFLKPELIDVKQGFAPFFLSIDQISDFYIGQETITRRDNLQEWQERYCNQAEIVDLEQMIYFASIRDLNNLRTSVLSKSVPLNATLNGNSFARYLKRFGCAETVDYIIFARYCEPYVVGLEPWEEDERDVGMMEDLIAQGIASFEETESHYIRLRFAYQIIRLAHYAKLYERVLELYDYLMPKIDNDPSIVEYWIEGHRAGAMMELGQNVEASYIFSQIFDKCPSKREQAFRSFNINTEEEWRACLNLCLSDHERANLYAIRANSSHSNVVEEMKNIYRYEPENKNLEILLFKELKKLEKDLLGLPFNDSRKKNKDIFDIPRDNAGDLVLSLKEFVQQVLVDRSIQKLDLWKIAEGYLELLAGNYYYAARTLKAAREQVQDDSLRKHLATFEMALEISALNKIDDPTEQKVADFTFTETFRAHEDFPEFLRDKLSSLYADQNHPGKSFMINHELSEMKTNPSMPMIDDLLAVSEKPRPNALERMLIRGQTDTTTIRDDLLDMKASLYLNYFQVEAAYNTFAKIDPGNWDMYGLFYPYIERIHDCVHCPFPDSIQLINKGQLLKELTDLDFLARAEPENAARYYFKLGLAYYNMTYFSYSWEVMDYFRSGSSLSRTIRSRNPGDVVYSAYYPLNNKENFDCSRALLYFERAIAYAKDPELAARATYMAAKCERNGHYAYGRERTYFYFDKLQSNYRGTQFYEKAIRECKYFAAYVSR